MEAAGKECEQGMGYGERRLRPRLGSAWSWPETFNRASPLSESVSYSLKMKMVTMSPSEGFARKKGDDLGKHQSRVRL